MPVPSALRGKAPLSPIATDWVPIGFTPDAARITQGQKDRRTGNAFPPYVAMNHSGVQLMGFANTMSMRYNTGTGYQQVAEYRPVQLQLTTPQVSGGGPSYVARLRASASNPAPRNGSLSARLKGLLTGQS